jgi:DNA polymerase III alpha subunit
VLTHDRLDDLVPIEPAAMEDRQVIEWDKDDIDALKFMKVDVLALGMLTCMKRASICSPSTRARSTWPPSRPRIRAPMR